MKHTISIAAIAFGLSVTSAAAVTCTTDTPISAGDVATASGVIGGGGTYHAVGSANCPDQTGPAGPAGPQGPAGQNGADGAPGANGQDGAPGANGQDGAPGATGAQGPQGVQGVAGANGTNGTNGADGAQGPKGDKGDTGATGAQGVAGAQGPKGDKGDKGDKGNTGVQGIAGKDGKDFDPADLERGLATVGALNVPHIDIGKRVGASGSVGFYNDEAAIGAGVAIRFDDTWQLGGSVATDTGARNVAGKIVATGQW